MKIKKKSLADSIRKVQQMSMQEKESFFDEIYIEQPNLLASVLVQQQMGNSLKQMEVLINILLVSYVALKESGIKISKISEDLQDKEMARFVASVKFTEGLSPSSIEDSLQQYVSSQNEKILLAFALNEMLDFGFTHLENESSKYLIMAGINMVNCISAVKTA